MKEHSVDVYFIGSRDSHLSEKTSETDKRLKSITGFSGSNGLAIITQEKAAMWSDGRYLIQAENELDCNWEFHQGSESGDTDWIHWINKNVKDSDTVEVASDPTLYSAVHWLSWEKLGKSMGLNFNPLKTNLIDEVWNDRPARPNKPLHVHKLEFAGERWESKVGRLRDSLLETGNDAMIVTALDEVAWLFNLRGEDFPKEK